MGVLVEDLLVLARLDQMPGRTERCRSTFSELAAPRRRRQPRSAPDREVSLERRRAARGARRPRPAAPAAGQPDAQRGHPHAARDADRAGGAARRPASVWSRSATTVRACPTAAGDAAVRALLAGRGRPQPRARAAPGSDWPSSRDRRPPTAAGHGRQRPGGGAVFRVELPLAHRVPSRCRPPSPARPSSQQSLSVLTEDSYPHRAQ